MSKAKGLPVQKQCPVCGKPGDAQADENGEHAGVWQCKHDDCRNTFFASSTVQFYDPIDTTTDWTWDTIREKYC